MFIRFASIFSLFFLSLCASVYGLQQDLNTAVQTLVPTVQSSNRVNYVNIAREIQFWLFVFVGIIAVAYIIYIGAKLLWAPGNTEEMTSAIKSITYIIIGLALIPFAYFIVQLIANIRLG
ncbi:hypothetical protein KBB89_01670 [Candidatus Gracilibacteria bacterium]|nr:hypothetical protein [Candidatus Gracilibacteria bacterium]